MSEPLNPLTLPLQGSRLIEASAGTGKTWTIAALYLRLVLGHGGAPRVPGEILVMTFTRAATRELSDRIRQRLVQAAGCFRGQPVPADDAFLEQLLQACPPGPAREQGAWRLAMAAEAMDDAAVHTIDAWCQRMLREHAFDSGCLFDEELQAQEAAMRAEAVRDFWRQQVYPLDDAALAPVLAQWPEVGALAADVAPLLELPLPPVAGQGSLQDAITGAQQRRAARLVALKAPWAAGADAMLDWLGAIWRDKKHPARKGVPGEKNACRWIEALRAWALDSALEHPDLTTTARERLTADALQASLASHGVEMPVPEVFARFGALLDDLAALPALAPALRLHAAGAVRDRLQQLKARAGTFGFADMLQRLDAALDERRHGARAQRLRQRIVAQYPVALIDEFQDTSPVQLSIFDRLYRIGEDEPSRALLLIGDPKQAIYGFRGADIYSYLGARRATAGRHHVLGTNHRSTVALVQAVNTLFEAAERRPGGSGAFQFGAPRSLPFVAVQAQGRPERLVAGGAGVPALTVVFDEPLRNKEDSRTLFAALCAERIVGLLNDAQAGFEETGEPFRRLRPADIAVLVRNRVEADAVRREMRRRGLASVYLSDSDSVWQTQEAADLLRLLQAVAAPRDMRLARAALATALLGFSVEELVALAADDERFDRQCERLQALHQTWQTQGVLAMVRRALHAFGLPARWLAPLDPTQQGERRLTNVLHLAELLQAASAQAEGEQALVRWLARQIADGAEGLNGGDEGVLRLESDADLVQVVTVHKSKGLEYPLVFLPFAAHFRELVGNGESARDAVLWLPRTDAATGAPDAEPGGRDLVLAPTPAQLAQAEQERQREALRLLYVALTRARHALWVGLSALQVGRSQGCSWHRSAIGYLLSGAEETTSAQRLEAVLALARAGAEVHVEQVPTADELPLPHATRLHRRGIAATLAQAPVYGASFERDWNISSYTALVRDAAWGGAGSGAVPVRAVLDDEPADASGAAPSAGTHGAGAGAGVVAAVQAGQPWHRFPRGALPGNFLHDQLEWLAAEGFALDASAELQLALARRCERQGWGRRSDDVVAWLRRVCTQPLPPLGVPLAGLGVLAPEMEFWLPSDGLHAGQVDSLCRQHLLPGRPRPVLPERRLKGLLMGFADLVFEHQGRYWVLDYKSNTLGARDADYTPAAMEAAMLEHRYDVQAALYLLALHRLLRARLGAAYAPAQHLGGALYFFLRGVGGPAAGCCTVAPPLALLDALDTIAGNGAVGSFGAVGTEGRAAPSGVSA